MLVTIEMASDINRVVDAAIDVDAACPWTMQDSMQWGRESGPWGRCSYQRIGEWVSMPSGLIDIMSGCLYVYTIPLFGWMDRYSCYKVWKLSFWLVKWDIFYKNFLLFSYIYPFYFQKSTVLFTITEMFFINFPSHIVLFDLDQTITFKYVI